MIPTKLLIGGVAAVGSVSTAAVVANQYGLFSTSSNQTQSSNDATGTDVQPTPQAEQSSVTNEKPNQKEIEKWLTTNKGEEDWKIQIKKTEDTQEKDFKDNSITESDLSGLKDYLDSSDKKDLLKSLFSALDTKTLTFEKTGGNWKHILTKEDIKKWVDKTSGNKSTLKFSEGNEAKELNDVQEEDLNKLLKDLFDGKSAFEKITLSGSESTKNILFEKDGTNWKHIKKAIEEWLKSPEGGNEKLKIQIKKSVSELYWNDSSFKEEDLIGLLKHLKDHKDTYVPKPEAGKDQSSVTAITVKLQKDSSKNTWTKVTNSSGGEN